jgi:glyoxylase-like metal-dependent hydrolase (beta-lactamase superfamily II)
MPERLAPGLRVVTAPNPGPMTFTGTRSYIVGEGEVAVIDPGPDDPAHVDAVASATGGAVKGIVLTHSHADHAGAVDALVDRLGGGVRVVLPEGDGEVGPFRVLSTPGHAPDHVCLLLGRILFTGDTVLGEGSVFVAPGEGSLAAYLDSLRRLRSLPLAVLCPGHGPYVWDPAAKLDEYIAHRLDRERRLIEALDAGLRSRDELLDAAWSDAPAQLRDFAGLSLASHLEKLAEEGRLPEGVER